MMVWELHFNVLQATLARASSAAVEVSVLDVYKRLTTTLNKQSLIFFLFSWIGPTEQTRCDTNQSCWGYC